MSSTTCNLKRFSVCFLLIISLVVIPLPFNKTEVHAAKTDDISKIAKSKKGKGIGSFPGWFHNGRWCSDFVWWAAGKAKLMNGKTYPKKRLGGVSSIQSYYKKKGRYFKSSKSFKPKKGDLAIFGSSSHVGIVTKVKGSKVYVTHGNWSNKVCVTKIKKTGYDSSAHASIKGYARPNYLASEPKFHVSFDATGGEVSVSKKKVQVTRKFGELPTPEKEGHEFVGWTTKIDGGKTITSKSIVKSKKIKKLYAQYECLEDYEHETPCPNQVQE